MQNFVNWMKKSQILLNSILKSQIKDVATATLKIHAKPKLIASRFVDPMKFYVCLAWIMKVDIAVFKCLQQELDLEMVSSSFHIHMFPNMVLLHKFGISSWLRDLLMNNATSFIIFVQKIKNILIFEFEQTKFHDL